MCKCTACSILTVVGDKIVFGSHGSNIPSHVLAASNRLWIRHLKKKKNKPLLTSTCFEGGTSKALSLEKCCHYDANDPSFISSCWTRAHHYSSASRVLCRVSPRPSSHFVHTYPYLPLVWHVLCVHHNSIPSSFSAVIGTLVDQIGVSFISIHTAEDNMIFKLPLITALYRLYRNPSNAVRPTSWCLLYRNHAV